jgi:hypothetical protein
MAEMRKSSFKKILHLGLRKLLGRLPAALRFAFYRAMVDCDLNPDPRLELKVAQSKEELAACFSLLHDAYVASGFMKSDPSGMRVTQYSRGCLWLSLAEYF